MGGLKGWIHAACLVQVGCNSHLPSRPEGSGQAALHVDAAARELRFSALFHRHVAEEGTWHLIVHDGGGVAGQAIFTTSLAPGEFYQALRRLGAVDGNNVSAANMADEAIATAGDRLEFSFLWEGMEAPLALTDLLAEVVPESVPGREAAGLDMHFGGNYTGDDEESPPCHVSGCLACLYTCSAGVTSNARANLALLKKDGNAYRYRLNLAASVADGARVTVLVRKRPSG